VGVTGAATQSEFPEGGPFALNATGTCGVEESTQLIGIASYTQTLSSYSLHQLVPPHLFTEYDIIF
jgi:hypothetical protein